MMCTSWGLGSAAPVGTRARPSDLSLISVPGTASRSHPGEAVMRQDGFAVRSQCHACGGGGLHQMPLLPCAGATGLCSPICHPALQLLPLLPPAAFLQDALGVICTARHVGAQRLCPSPRGSSWPRPADTGHQCSRLCHKTGQRLRSLFQRKVQERIKSHE